MALELGEASDVQRVSPIRHANVKLLDHYSGLLRYVPCVIEFDYGHTHVLLVAAIEGFIVKTWPNFEKWTVSRLRLAALLSNSRAPLVPHLHP